VRLLAEAVERLKALQSGEIPPPPALTRPAVAIDLPITAHLPEGFIPDLNLRLAVYQRLAQAQTDVDVAAIEQELTDRFGPPPPPAKNLLWVVRLRILATTAGIGAVQTEEAAFVIRLLPGRELDRPAVERKLRPSTSSGQASVTAHMVRLNRNALGDNWREGIVRALAVVNSALAVPA